MRAAWTNQIFDPLFRFELQNIGVPAATLDAEVMIGIFTIEGLLMHNQDERQQRVICTTLATRWPRQEAG